jgi:hypothetical protein
MIAAGEFVTALDLEGVPAYGEKHLAPPPPRFVAKSDEAQAIVVGSQLQAFTDGVDESTRRALANAMLLAQLAAQKKAGRASNEAWYRAYFDTLANLGLAVEERSFSVTDSGAIQADVHKAVLELAATLLGGPAAPAVVLIAATLGAIEKLAQDSPAVTIFRREAQHERAGRFQVSVAESHAGAESSLSLLAFSLKASSTLTQVLFFKFKAEEARLEHLSATLGVNEDSLQNLAGPIAQKVAKYQEGYLRQLKV